MSQSLKRREWKDVSQRDMVIMMGSDGGGNNGIVVMHDGGGVYMCVWSKREIYGDRVIVEEDLLLGWILPWVRTYTALYLKMLRL